MLPPQLRSSLSATRQRSLLSNERLAMNPSSARVRCVIHQSRTFWGWRRPNDYASHIDPSYHRFAKYRTLKTKAKLLEKLRRRGRFEWDLDQKPFFAPRNLRWASFYNGKPASARWVRAVNEEDGNKKEAKRAEPEDVHELSQAEREWKEQMEALRKRVEQDPYEAVFGKRFEPFWSPLVPSWMREEMGLQGWPLVKATAKQGKSGDVSVAKPRTAPEPNDVQQTPSQATKATSNSTSTTVVAETSKESEARSTTDPLTYSSMSSTSWDSWTRKARRTEWDSVSGETKRWEYDPISNRMVQIKNPASSESTEVKAFDSSDKQVPAKRQSDMQSLINTPSRELDPKAVEVPVKKFDDARKAIPIPQQLDQVKLTNALCHENDVQKSMTVPRPAALASLPKSDLDLLTADNVRASMGKMKQSSPVKPTTPAEKAAMEAAFDKQTDPAMATEASVSTQQTSLPEGENPGTAGRIINRNIFEDYYKSVREARSKLRQRMHDNALKAGARNDRLQTSLDRANVPKEHTSSQSALQPALERMQSGDPSKVTELDDAAAHESTEPLEPRNVPQAWSRQADLLQADRVKRLASKRPYPMTRWLDDMQARRAAYEASKTPSAAEQAAAAEKSAKLEKANALLAAEVQEQKFLMQSHENRYAHKIRSLRQELESAYKQSAVHSEMHVERIDALKAELDKAQKAAGGSSMPDMEVQKPVDPRKEMQGEGDFCTNVTKYTDSSKWYKRPAITVPVKPNDKEVAKAEQKARDSALIKEVREIYEKKYGVIDTKHRQQESAPIKRNHVAELVKKNRIQRAEEPESDVVLDDALGKHENDQMYQFRADGLEADLKKDARDIETAQLTNEIAVQEQKAHEAQASATPKPKAGVQVNAKAGVTSDVPVDVQPKQEIKLKKESNMTPVSTPDEPSVQWEEPSIYKVLAYDSGNDTFSTATTTSNFTGSETAISIPEALSQLYQPARFVSHFADLQKGGYQVIYGTRDLLVFKKVKNAAVESNEQSKTVQQSDPSLIDESFIKPKENALAEEAANFYDKYKPKPRPYDPTSIENGKLMPYENALAQEAANYYDQRTANINPIDGTTRTQEPVSTGNFASPTGFVNHDPVFPSEMAQQGGAQAAQQQPFQRGPQLATDFHAMVADDHDAARQAAYEEDIEYRHYPRVRREEPVFSGTRRTGRGWNRRHERHQQREDYSHRSKDQKKRGGTFRWALGVGIGAAGVAYAFGVAAEAARQRKVDAEKERWQQIVEGKRRWWE